MSQPDYGEPQVSRTPYAEPDLTKRRPRVQHLGRNIRIEGTMPDVVDDRRLDDVPAKATIDAARVRAWISVVLILSGTMALVAGVSLLVSAAAGLTVAGAIVLAVGVLLGLNN